MAASEETQRGSMCGELLSLKPAFGTLASALPGPIHPSAAPARHTAVLESAVEGQR